MFNNLSKATQLKEAESELVPKQYFFLHTTANIMQALQGLNELIFMSHLEL